MGVHEGSQNYDTRPDPDAVADLNLGTPTAGLARLELAAFFVFDGMTNTNDGDVGTYCAVLADDDICDRGIQDGAVAVDESGGCNVQSEAVVDVNRDLDIGNAWAGNLST